MQNLTESDIKEYRGIKLYKYIKIKNKKNASRPIIIIIINVVVFN